MLKLTRELNEKMLLFQEILAAQINILNRHRITELLRWEKLSMIKSNCSSSSAKAITNPCPQVLHQCPRQPLLGLDNNFWERRFPDIQLKSPVAHLEPVFSCPKRPTPTKDKGRCDRHQQVEKPYRIHRALPFYSRLKNMWSYQSLSKTSNFLCLQM